MSGRAGPSSILTARFYQDEPLVEADERRLRDGLSRIRLNRAGVEYQRSDARSSASR